MIKQGGPTMIFLGICSIAGVALIIRNFLHLQERKLLRPELWPSLEAVMLDRDIDQARTICNTQSCMLTDVLDAGLARITADTVEAETIEKAIEEKATEQTTTLMAPINYLSLVGVISPMLGLLGTVLGMIGAFRTISLGGMGKPELLANDIGEALITTATGLMIGIPAMAFYLYFKNSFLRSISRMGLVIGGLLDSLHSEKPQDAESWEVE
ncbi:MAG: MotA/TolQ/ExbB proton channel family protein [Kiritimatiellae bacterium]|nr:MotA/TolQ/ExbB proton channel family protein [Kiritimatiellia bacterium]